MADTVKRTGSVSTNGNGVVVPGRHEAVNGLIDFVMMPVGILAAFDTVKNQSKMDEGNVYVSPLAMDIFTVDMHREKLADELVAMAEKYPVIGVLIDRLAPLAGAGGALGVVLAIGMQCAENHGALPAAIRAGAKVIDRSQMATLVALEAQAKAEAMAAATAEHAAA